MHTEILARKTQNAPPVFAMGGLEESATRWNPGKAKPSANAMDNVTDGAIVKGRGAGHGVAIIRASAKAPVSMEKIATPMTNASPVFALTKNATR